MDARPEALRQRVAALGFDEVLETCGADLWLDTLGCLPILEGRRVALALGVGDVRRGEVASR